MGSSNPLLDVGAQLRGEASHLSDLDIGYGFRPLIIGDVPLLPKQIKLAELCRIESDRELERLDDPVMMVSPLGAKTGCGEGGGRKLKGGIVRDIEPPVSYESCRFARPEIAIRDREQVCDFLRSCRVLGQPPEFEPVS